MHGGLAYPEAIPAGTDLMTQPEHSATFRFYEELNDFLPESRKKRDFLYAFHNSPAIKDPIEAIGVPHTEVELILVNGVSVGFDYRLKDGDRVSVYPVFEAFDVSALVRLRGRPLRDPRFVCDVHLGKLTRYLRILGFDTRYRNDFSDARIVAIATSEDRIVLTRDRRLLHHRVITHGYWIRSHNPDEQVHEVLQRFDLAGNTGLLSRCPACNGLLEPVSKADILDQLEPLTRQYYDTFYRCAHCGQIYWRGSHFEQLRKRFHLWSQQLNMG